MTRQKLLIISFSDINSDARVLKQVALFRDKYELYTCSHGTVPEGVAGHFEIPEQLTVWQYNRVDVVTKRYRRAYWANAAIRAAQTLLSAETFDAVLANDIDSVGLALSLKPRFGVHADLHEYAPRQKEQLLRWRLFVAPFMRWMCRAFVTQAKSVTTVGQGIADEYSRRFGMRVEVVTNAAPYTDVSPLPPGNPLRLVHSGACLRDRNIHGIVEAVEASAPGTTLDLYLTPSDPVYMQELRERARQSDRITLVDPVPYSELVTTLNAYDVGIHILPPVSFNNAWALPNKFFDYVQARLGLIIGPSHEMARLLNQYQFGAVAADYSTQAVTSVLDQLTAEMVWDWKRASAVAAHDLSAESQIVVWSNAIDRLMPSDSDAGTRRGH